MAKHQEEVEALLDLEEPPLYRVLLHNDDYTSMEFVIEVLMSIFKMHRLKAEQVMLQIHHQGKAIVGIYTYEIAQTKAQQTKALAKKNGFPLLATIEEDS